MTKSAISAPATARLEPRTNHPAVTKGAAQTQVVQLGGAQLPFAWSENQCDQFLRLKYANNAHNTARRVYKRPTMTFRQSLNKCSPIWARTSVESFIEEFEYQDTVCQKRQYHAHVCIIERALVGTKFDQLGHIKWIVRQSFVSMVRWKSYLGRRASSMNNGGGHPCRKMSDKDARLVEGAPLTMVTLLVNGRVFSRRGRRGLAWQHLPGDPR